MTTMTGQHTDFPGLNMQTADGFSEGREGKVAIAATMHSSKPGARFMVMDRISHDLFERQKRSQDMTMKTYHKH